MKKITFFLAVLYFTMIFASTPMGPTRDMLLEVVTLDNEEEVLESKQPRCVVFCEKVGNYIILKLGWEQCQNFSTKYQPGSYFYSVLTEKQFNQMKLHQDQNSDFAYPSCATENILSLVNKFEHINETYVQYLDTCIDYCGYYTTPNAQVITTLDRAFQKKYPTKFLYPDDNALFKEDKKCEKKNRKKSCDDKRNNIKDDNKRTMKVGRHFRHDGKKHLRKGKK
jgi:hypothetical protein